MKNIFLFAIFYFVQGAIQSYLSNFQKPYLIGKGVSLENIAWISSVMLVPFSIKIVFAWVSDNFSFLGDHRKSYMLFGLALAFLCYFFLGFVDPSEHFYLFFCLIVISAVGMSIFDSCADGLAVDVSTKSNQGQIQSAMMFGRGVGYIIVSVVFGYLAMGWGYHSVFLALSAIIAIVFIYTLQQSPAKTLSKMKSWQELKKDGWEYLSSQGRIFCYLFFIGIYYSIILYGIDGITSLHGKLNLQMNEQQLGYAGSFQGVGTLVGAIAAAVLMKLFNIKNVSLTSVCGLTTFGIFVALSGKIDLFYLAIFGWGVVWAMQETVFLTLAVHISHGQFAATVFAALMMSSNIGVLIGEWIATMSLTSHSVSDTILLFSLGQLTLLPLLVWYLSSATKKNGIKNRPRLL